MNESMILRWGLGTICVFSLANTPPVDAEAADGSSQHAAVGDFIDQSCAECHNGDTSEGGLNLKQLPWKFASQESRQQWVQIHDRIENREMPPDAEDLSAEERRALLDVLSKAIRDADYSEVVAQGRGPMRRLNRGEYEANLREVLRLPHLDVREMLPEDREANQCNKSAKTLDISRVQLAAWLDVADTALRQAVASGVKPRESARHRLPATRMFAAAQTYGGREAMFYAKNSQMLTLTGADLARVRKENSHDPKVELAIFRSPSWPYYGYPDTFRAVEAGAYRVRFSARAVRQVRNFRLRPAWEPAPMTFRARKRSGPDVSGDVRATGGVIDIQPTAAVYETTVRLKRNETLEYSLLGLAVPRAINPDDGPLYYDFPPMPPGGHPGIAFQWLEIVGPVDSSEWPPPSHKVLFDDLPIRPATGGRLKVDVVSERPAKDAVRLMQRFVRHAARQPVPNEAVEVYEKLVLAELERGIPLTEALLAGYSAFLCSGHFLYLQEPTANEASHRPDDHAIASRLSHFLWNSRPDVTLTDHAINQQLRNRKVLQSEVDRLIGSKAFEQFVTNFTDYWLSLKDIRRDEPDVRLYPEYRFDDYLIESMESETRAFFAMMVRDNLPVTALIDTDFVLVNDRLSRHYELKPVSGSRLRKVELPQSSPYGGLITQAAIMKVTANGSTTSPVIRGVWIMERIIGDPPPPPPIAVPAVKPDIRGATTIREQLAKHTQDRLCAACHARFDPVGFALENFDVMGAWRDRYRSLGSGEEVTGIDRAGHDYAYRVAESVDASGRLRDGATFRNITDLKALFLKAPRPLARNLLHRFTAYATGTPVRFSDRPVIEQILDRCRGNGFRTRDLIHGLVQSRIFLGESNLSTTEDEREGRRQERDRGVSPTKK